MEDTAVSNYMGREHMRRTHEYERRNDIHEPSHALERNLRHEPRHEARHMAERHTASGYPEHYGRYDYDRMGPHHAERRHMGEGMHSDWDHDLYYQRGHAQDYAHPHGHSYEHERLAAYEEHPYGYGHSEHAYDDHYGHMYGDMHHQHEHARTVYSDLDHQILDQQYIDEKLRQDHYRREHYRQNSTPTDNSRHATHRRHLTREERDARDLVRRSHEESRKREEERLHEEEERRHREEERRHVMEEEQRHREEELRHAQAEEEDKWRKQHEEEMRVLYPELGDIETPEHARLDEYVAHGAEVEDEKYADLPCHHTFEEDDKLFSNQQQEEELNFGFGGEFHHGERAHEREIDGHRNSE